MLGFRAKIKRKNHSIFIQFYSKLDQGRPISTFRPQASALLRKLFNSSHPNLQYHIYVFFMSLAGQYWNCFSGTEENLKGIKICIRNFVLYICLWLYFKDYLPEKYWLGSNQKFGKIYWSKIKTLWANIS
jgi:hypothetical protein